MGGPGRIWGGFWGGGARDYVEDGGLEMLYHNVHARPIQSLTLNFPVLRESLASEVPSLTSHDRGPFGRNGHQLIYRVSQAELSRAELSRADTKRPSPPLS